MILIIAYIFAGFLLALLVGLLYLFLRYKASSNIRPYRDLRGELINQAKNGRAPSRVTHRPPGLDTRIDISIADQMRTFDIDNPGDGTQRVALYKLFAQVIDSIHDELDAISGDSFAVDLIAAPRRIVFTVYWFESEINNGGFDQWYLNSAGDTAADAADALRLLGIDSLAKLVERANTVFPDQPPRDRATRLSQMDDISESDSDLWDALSTEFYELDIKCDSTLIHYILENESYFFIPS